jgi:hypothetical protein
VSDLGQDHRLVGPRVDVMITIICDFCIFWAKKLAMFAKANVMITFCKN